MDSKSAKEAQGISKVIREKGNQVLAIAEQLNVLAINTAIEASKVGDLDRGVGVIAAKMKAPCYLNPR